MKSLIATLQILILSSCVLIAQPGFNKWFDFDNAALFHEVFYENDTLIVAGTIYNDDEDQWGTLLVKMDTLGNIHEHKSYFDPEGGQQAFALTYEASLGEDTGILVSGVLFYQDKYFVLKLNRNGEMVIYRRYELLPNECTVLPFKFIETDNGFYLFSNKQLSDYKTKVSITKLDNDGNIQWEQIYAHPFNNKAFLTDVWQKDANTFVIGSSFGYTDEWDMENSWLKSWIFAVDSLGNTLWENVNAGEGSIRGIHQLDNGDWAYSARAFYPSPYSNFDFYYKPKVVRRDSNFNLLWQYEMAHSDSYNNETIDMAIAPDGHFIGIGHWLVPDEYVAGGNPIPDEESFFGGCLYKISNIGDSIWIQCDTGIVNGYTTHHKLGGMVVLPSGSIIAVGSFSALDGNNRPVGWVLKRDRNGCMEELCTITGLEDLEAHTSATAVKVYPNPASQRVYFEWGRDQPYNGSLHIYDITGHLVHQAAIGAAYQWEVGEVPEGLYIYRVLKEISPHGSYKMAGTGKIVIQR